LKPSKPKSRSTPPRPAASSAEEGQLPRTRPQTNFTGGVDIGHMGNQEIRSPDFHFVALIDEPENVRTRIYWNL